MAEKIVSPGVFTREKDLSFLPQGIAEIGACIIGSTRKGPAFIPTLCDSMADFETKFGAVWEDSYLPFTVQQYMKSAGQVTIVRVLGEAGHVHNQQVAFVLGESAAAVNAATHSGHDANSYDPHDAGGRKYYITAAGKTYTFESDHGHPVSSDVPAGNYYFFGTGSSDTNTFVTMSSKINSVLTGIVHASNKAGADPENGVGDKVIYVTASNGGTNGNSIYLQSGSGELSTLKKQYLSGGVNATGGTIVGIGNPVKGEGSGDSGTDQYNFHYRDNSSQVYFPVDGTAISSTATWDSGDAKNQRLHLSSSSPFSVDGVQPTAANQRNYAHAYTMSFDKSDSNYFGTIFGRDKDGNQPMYLWKEFRNKATELKASKFTIDKVNVSWEGNGYSAAKTPNILSQDGAILFNVHTLAHGTNANEEIKIAISNVKKPGTVPGSDYGSFNLTVRKYYDGISVEGDLRPIVLEQYNNVSLDPDSPLYFPRAIGDRWTSIDANGKLTLNGDWPNKSKYIRVDNYKTAAPLVNHVPWGFSAYVVPFDTEGHPTTAIPTTKYVTSQSADGQYNSKVMFGIDFSDYDTREYHSSIDKVSANIDQGANVNFSLNDTGAKGVQHHYSASCPVASRQFVVGFQYGYDGFAPTRVVKKGIDIVGGNTQGWNLATVENDTDYSSFKKAINAVSNVDEFDINMLVIPGVDALNHSPVTTYAKNMCEDRGDTFYIMDNSQYGTGIATATGTATSFDTNYAAMYYPWVRILDTSTGKLVWVPPSVVMAGVIAFTDKVSHEWFAPAGLLRGGLSDVIEAETRLTHDERDELYENRLNPIASFPGQGVVVWGQKTLQGKPSALDRVNVRRLLIKLKKFIASSTKFLVFEQNTAATRNRFLNIVNPFLEQVQQNSGLSAFKVVMDDTNNTPDLIDRNILFGQIYIQPTRTAEFIILDFNIMPTGATFPE